LQNKRQCRIAVIDLTDIHHAEIELQASDENFHLFFEKLPAPVAIFDRKMRYVIASRRWLESYGIEDQDLTGRSHYEVFPQIPERWKEAHRRELAGEVERCD